MSESQKIYVAGHRGMVGSAIVRHLLAQGAAKSDIITRTGAADGHYADLLSCATQLFPAQENPT
jgi:nucleoside-diphosphate-sugar epimerase